MTRTTVAVAQSIWGCRWSRPGYRIAGVDERLQTEPTWVCVSDGVRAIVPECRCETCERWEPAADRMN